MTPIAIVGRACVLSGALSPQHLWDAVLAGRDLTRGVPAGRWRVPGPVLCAGLFAFTSVIVESVDSREQFVLPLVLQ